MKGRDNDSDVSGNNDDDDEDVEGCAGSDVMEGADGKGERATVVDCTTGLVLKL